MTPEEIRELKESGVLLVDKPAEWTSHDVVGCIRGRFRFRKVGHCGTLDPAATGLLVVVLGQATRLSDKLSGQDKVYAGTLRLGVETDSQDRDGKVTRTVDAAHITAAAVEQAAARFTGELQQIPPMVSAIKVDGRPLYKLARKGLEIVREPRPITIHRLTLGRIAIPDVAFEVACSKGTYVRTLAADIGAALGVGAHLLDLRRLRSGAFSVADAVTMDTVKGWTRDDCLARMIPIASLVPYLK